MVVMIVIVTVILTVRFMARIFPMAMVMGNR